MLFIQELLNFLAPLILLSIGWVTKNKPPTYKKGIWQKAPIRWSKSKISWQSAHKYLGVLYIQLGVVLLGITILVRVFKSFPIVCAINSILLVVFVLFAQWQTIRYIERKFDKHGNPLSGQ